MTAPHDREISSPVSGGDRAHPPRIVSVDALRGFDMFWIIGGEEVARAIAPLSGSPLVSTIGRQFKHAAWEGFRFFDLIFPFFLFLVGVSIVLSLDRVRAASGHRAAYLRIARRSLLLFGLGILYYGGVTKQWPDVAVSGVLPRIALCYFFAATLYLLLPRRGIVAAAALCLIGYWALLMWVPFPDVNIAHPHAAKDETQEDAQTPAELLAGVSTTVHGTFTEGHNLADYIDFRWLPGRKGHLYYTNEGLLSTIPAVATTLFGIMAGWLLTHAGWSDRKKVAWLLGAGAAGVALGLLWGLQFPIIKRIWTSSFCLLASGCASMLLGIFYLVVDVWRWQRWCIPFLWIGTNALTAYLLVNLVSFDDLAQRFVGGDVTDFLDDHLMPRTGEAAIAVVSLTLTLLLLRFLYRRKVFIRL